MDVPSDQGTPPAARTATRRLVLRASLAVGGAGVVASLGACGLRWEHGAPDAQASGGSPSTTTSSGGSTGATGTAATATATATTTTTTTAAVRELTSALRLVRAALSRAGTTGSGGSGGGGSGGAGGTAWGTVHARQEAALLARLTSYGAPIPDRSPTEPGTPISTATVVALEAAGTDRATRSRLRVLPGTDRDLLLTILVQRAGLAASLTPTAGSPMQPGQSSYAASDALRLLALARAGEYGLQVATGQVGSASRAAAVALLADMTGHRVGLERQLGAAAPAPAIGYRLPHAVNSPASAQKLLRSLARDAEASVLLGADAAAGDDSDWQTLVDWLVHLERWRGAIGLALTAFPGR